MVLPFGICKIILRNIKTVFDMKKLLYVVVALIMFSACKKKDKESPATIIGTWKMEKITWVEDGKTKEENIDVELYIQLFENKKVYSVLFKSNGSYENSDFEDTYTLSGNELTFEKGWFLEGIKKVTYNLKGKDALDLIIKDGSNEATFSYKRVSRNLEDDKRNIENMM
jgi:hypothetical protein